MDNRKEQVGNAFTYARHGVQVFTGVPPNPHMPHGSGYPHNSDYFQNFPGNIDFPLNSGMPRNFNSSQQFSQGHSLNHNSSFPRGSFLPNHEFPLDPRYQSFSPHQNIPHNSNFFPPPSYSPPQTIQQNPNFHPNSSFSHNTPHNSNIYPPPSYSPKQGVHQSPNFHSPPSYSPNQHHPQNSGFFQNSSIAQKHNITPSSAQEASCHAPSIVSPPPLKKMSTADSSSTADRVTSSPVHIKEEPKAPSSPKRDEGTDIQCPPNTDVSLPVSQNTSKKSSQLDSLLGRIIANKGNDMCSSALTSENLPNPSAEVMNPPQLNPPPLKKCVPSPEPSKSRRKQAMPRSKEEQSSASSRLLGQSLTDKTIAIPDIDSILASSEKVRYSDIDIEIQSDDDDDDDSETYPVKMSRKGRVIKKPARADIYTTELSANEELECDEMEWTPDKSSKANSRTPTDSFKPRSRPVLNAAEKGLLTHDDLHPSLVYSNPPAKLLIPLQSGWMRELVIRNPQLPGEEDRKVTNADAYYYAPSEYGSVKLRSAVKVQEFLQEHNLDNLSADNFTFMKKSIYKAPEEFVRMAGKAGAGGRSAKRSSTPGGKMKSSPSKSSSSPLPSDNPTPTASTYVDGALKVIKLESTKRRSPTMHVSTPKKIKADKKAIERAKEYLMATETPPESPESDLVKEDVCRKTMSVIGPPGKPPSSLQRIPIPCTLQCADVKSSTPTIQCGVCLLLYHPECVNWATMSRDALFVCETCILKSKLNTSQLTSAYRISGSNSALVCPTTGLPTYSSCDAEKSSSKTPLINRALNTENGGSVTKAGRLITIPLHALEKIDTKAPFALKLNNETYRVDPSSLIRTESGVKIFIKTDQQPNNQLKMGSSAGALFKDDPQRDIQPISLLSVYNHFSVLEPEKKSYPDNLIGNLKVEEEISDLEFQKTNQSNSEGLCTAYNKPVYSKTSSQRSHEEKEVVAGVVNNMIKAIEELESLKPEIDLHAHLTKPYSQAAVAEVPDRDLHTHKLNKLNKPTDIRLSNTMSSPQIGSIASMSEILYEGKKAKVDTFHSVRSRRADAMAHQVPLRIIAANQENGQMVILPAPAANVNGSTAMKKPAAGKPAKVHSKPERVKALLEAASQTDARVPPLLLMGHDRMFSLTSLAYSTLLKIFGFLSFSDRMRLSRVCRLWRAVASDRLLWKSVKIEQELKPEAVRHLNRLLPFYTPERLVLKLDASSTDKISLPVGVRSVKLSGVLKPYLALLKDSCNLQEVDLRLSTGSAGQKDVVVSLEELDMPSVQSLTLAADDFLKFTAGTVEKGGQWLNKLQKLTLMSLTYPLSEDVIRNLLSLPDLVHLSLAFVHPSELSAPCFSDEAIHAVLKSENLKRLHLSCESEEETVLQTAIPLDHCSISHLSVEGFNPLFVANIVSAISSQLQELAIKLNLVDESILNSLKLCENLRILNLRCNGPPEDGLHTSLLEILPKDCHVSVSQI